MNLDSASAHIHLSSRLANEAAGAVFSDDRRYRYLLWRQWSGVERLVLFVALNPSTADERDDDPTIRRCRGYARAWGASGFMVANLFAFRATRPVDLLSALEPVGKDNDSWLQLASLVSATTVACWGNHGRHLDRSACVLRLLKPVTVLKVNRTGEPCHPLYLPQGLKPIAFYAK